MHFLNAILLVLPLALASPTSPGCGTIQDKTSLGETLIGDNQCHGIGADAKSWSVDDECVCVAFNTNECSDTKPETWEYLTGGHTDVDLSGRGVKWYKCFTSESLAYEWVAKFEAANLSSKKW
ncbi:hypothetical protein ST47_g5968 [Ascochyta rabiei]|uniref:Uncharacterized protein n=1 Tax=Didymella rabiei TaxID=5454 RepID=A0A163D499_DIDRA|nr:hypothetical protein ST47_g5968 [Ascochyta rabiei]